MLIERMAKELGLSSQFITNLALGASHEYKRYTVKKKNGGEREILHPSRRLKTLQVWLLRNVVEGWPVHDAAIAYRPGRSIQDNAIRHIASRYLLRLDMRDFFPSIQASDLSNYLKDSPALLSGWTANDRAIVSSLLFRNGRLTIGAPTSPALSNALCYKLDLELAKMSEARHLTYTRYADDLFFSATEKNILVSIEGEVSSILAALACPKNLEINSSKTQHSSRKGRREVTGLILGSDGQLYVSRGYKRKVRALIHKYDSLEPVARVALSGMIAFVTGVEPDFYNRLALKYGATQMLQITTFPTMLERQHLHLPKVKPSLKKSRRKSSSEIMREILRAAGFDPD